MIGTIYKIVCNLDSSFVYIGSTFKTPRQRLEKHKVQYRCYKKGIYNKYSIYDKFDIYEPQNFTIIKIKDYEVCDYKHLRAYELLWYNKEKHNTKVINSNMPMKIRLKKNNKVKK